MIDVRKHITKPVEVSPTDDSDFGDTLPGYVPPTHEPLPDPGYVPPTHEPLPDPRDKFHARASALVFWIVVIAALTAMLWPASHG